MASNRRGFVQVPNLLVEWVEMPDAALRLWIVIRKYNGENPFKACYAGAMTLDAKLERSARRSRWAKRESSRFRRAHRWLVDHRLLLAVRRAGTSSLRWAIRPGVDGDIEVKGLREEGEISEGQLERFQCKGVTDTAEQVSATEHLDERPTSHDTDQAYTDLGLIQEETVIREEETKWVQAD